MSQVGCNTQELLRVVISGCSSMAELQPSKLVVRVRFPSPAHLEFDGFGLNGYGLRCCSSVVERVLGKDEVMGSIPISSLLILVFVYEFYVRPFGRVVLLDLVLNQAGEIEKWPRKLLIVLNPT